MVYIHQLQIVHRDLKPANVFLRIKSDGKETVFEPIIADFGICVFAQEYSVNKDSLFVVKALSVKYAAPEVYFSFSFLLSFLLFLSILF